MQHAPPLDILMQRKSFWNKGQTLYLLVVIYPSAIPRHFFLISTLITSLKKIEKNTKGREWKQISNVNQGL